MDSYKIIKRAIQMLQPVLAEMDCSFTNCGSCGQKHYSHWEQKKIADNVQAAITKLTAAEQAMEKEGGSL